MVSSHYAFRHHGVGDGEEYWDAVLKFGAIAVCFGNMATIAVCGILYLNYQLFYSYMQLFLWATLLAIGLRRTKQRIMRSLFPAAGAPASHARVRNLFRFAREVCANPLGHHRAVRNASLFAGVLAVLSMTIPWWVVLVVLAVLMALSVVQLALMDRGCMPHRYLCGSDGAAVALTLMFAVILLVSLLTVFFALKCTQEGTEAVQGISGWIDRTVNEEERLQVLMSSQGFRDGVESVRNQTLTFLNTLNRHTNTTLIDHLRNMTMAMGSNFSSGGATGNALAGATTAAATDTAAATAAAAVAPAPSLVPGFSLPNMTLMDLGTEMWETLTAFNATEVVLHGGLSLGTGTVTVIAVLSSTGIEVITMLVMLGYLLSSDKDWLLTVFATCIPMGSADYHAKLTGDVTRIVEAAVLLPIKLSFVRGLTTFVCFHWLLGAPFPHFATLVMFVTAFVPMILPILGVLPWVIADLFINKDVVIRGLLILAYAIFLLPLVESQLHADLGKYTHPYATSLAIYAGWAYAGPRGIILGPIVMLLLQLLQRLIAGENWYRGAEDDDDDDDDNRYRLSSLGSDGSDVGGIVFSTEQQKKGRGAPAIKADDRAGAKSRRPQQKKKGKAASPVRRTPVRRSGRNSGKKGGSNGQSGSSRKSKGK